MREIKFRGIRKKQHEYQHMYLNDDPAWAYGSLVIDNDCFDILNILNDHGGFRTMDEVIPKTVGQFTGLSDSKRTTEFPEGQKIFEGDICIDHDGLDDYHYVVKWIFAGFQLVTYKKPTSNVRGISHGINQGYMENSYYIEVIGNIHQNPELLGGRLNENNINP